MAQIGFVGLGVMGAPMAGHLISAGHDVTVWNRSPGKDEGLIAAGAHRAGSLADVAERCPVVMICVGRSEDVAECVAGLRPGASSGSIFVDHSTIAPAAAVNLHSDLMGRGIGFIDAPITGGSMGAQKGTLTIFCGGDVSHFDAVKLYLSAYGKRVERVGPSGAGQTMKLANQIAVGGALLALCEALSFADRAGLDLATTRELLAGGAAGSWAFENYGPKILNRDWSPGFSITNQRKDFGYCIDAARELDAAVPGTQLVDRLLAKLDEAGHGDWTTAALFEVLRSEGFEA